MKVGPDFPTVHHARLQLAEREHGREIVHELAHQQVLVFVRAVLHAQLVKVEQVTAAAHRIFHGDYLAVLPVCAQQAGGQIAVGQVDVHLIGFVAPSVVWTDGIGNTSGVIPGKTITERQAAEGLISNVLRVERALERCVKQQPPQKVYDATVSFAFNVGTGNACSSTLVKLLNQRRWAEACRQLPRWVYVKGVFNQGLDNRRAREMAWCLKGAGL